VYLDATDPTRRAARFPTVYASCAVAGIDPGNEPIPVAPAAHFSCGGVVTDDSGGTGITGLYAAGERIAMSPSGRPVRAGDERWEDVTA